MDSEVDTHGIIVEALESGKRVAIPRCTAEKTLEFVEISSLQGLHQNKFGMLEPEASLPALKTPEFVGSVCLVPGLVFTTIVFLHFIQAIRLHWFVHGS